MARIKIEVEVPEESILAQIQEVDKMRFELNTIWREFMQCIIKHNATEVNKATVKEMFENTEAEV